MGDAPTLGLVHPTDEELRAQWKKNGAAWKGALSLEAYMRREVHLASQDLTRNGGITYWALVDTAAKDRIILSGCETLRKKALVAQSGKVKDVICHGIGSVFCPPELRRRGYAARMMKELAKALETWQAAGTECLFSVLWSDIGKVSSFVHEINIPLSRDPGGELSSVRECFTSLIYRCHDKIRLKFPRKEGGDAKDSLPVQ